MKSAILEVKIVHKYLINHVKFALVLSISIMIFSYLDDSSVIEKLTSKATTFMFFHSSKFEL